MKESKKAPTVSEPEDDGFLSFLKDIKSTANLYNQAEKDFQVFYKAPLHMVGQSRDQLLKNTHAQIAYQLKRLDLETMDYGDLPRIMLLLDELDNPSMIDYKQHVTETYTEKDPKSSVKPDKLPLNPKPTSQEQRDHAELTRIYNTEQDFIRKFNYKLKSILEKLERNIEETNFGDTSIPLEELTKVSFRFDVNESDDFTKLFVKEVRIANPDLVSKVVRVTFDDVNVDELPADTFEYDYNNTERLLDEAGFMKIVKDADYEAEDEDEDDKVQTSAPVATVEDVAQANPFVSMLADADARLPDPDGVKRCLEVRYWFANSEDAVEFEAARETVDQVYEKFVRYYRQH